MNQANNQKNKGLSQLDTLLQDVRFALRILRKSPRFTAMSLLIIALGIGFNTAIFSLIESIMLRPLPYSQPQHLFTIREIVPQLSNVYPTLPVNARHFDRWQKECSSFDNMAQMLRGSVSLVGQGEPERIASSNVSWNFFNVLGIQPQLGRVFIAEEDQPGKNNVAVLSDTLWHRRFNADPTIIDKTILLDGKPYVVIGILPSGFQYPDVELSTRPESQPEMFQPMGLDLRRIPDLGDFNYEVLARIRQGVAPEQALAELNTVQAQIASTLQGNIELRAIMRPLRDAVVGSARQSLLLVFTAVIAILLIVCINLANLHLVRAKRRDNEFAIRSALGASNSRLIRQFLTESLILVLIGGALGVLLAQWSISLIVKTSPIDLPRLNEVELNWTVLLFAFFASIFTGIMIGILPALRLKRIEPNENLKDSARTITGGRRSVKMRDIMVGAEVSISIVLTVAAGLLLLSFLRILHVNKGFQTENILTMNLTLPSTKYRDNKDIDKFYTETLRKVEAIPGVISVGLISALPLQGESWLDAVTVEGDQRPITQRPQANYRLISSDYFKTLGISLRAGRVFDENDRKLRAAVISEVTAEALWPGQDVIGKRFKRSADNEPPFEIVGVIADIRGISLQKQPGFMVYVPYWERLQTWTSLVIRTATNPSSVAPSVRSAIWQVDDQVPIARMRTMDELVNGSVSQQRFQLILVLLFALSALLLASVGIYGVVAESVASRTNEIAIRMALGADGSRIRSMVLREGMKPVLIGMVIGIAASFAVRQILNTFLFDVQATNLNVVLLAASLVLILVAMLACYLPARRAAKVAPLVALRYE